MAIQNSNLRPSFVNEVVKIVEDETIVRSKLKSVSDVYSWIEEYGRTSDTKWNLRSSRPSGTRLVCCIIPEYVDEKPVIARTPTGGFGPWPVMATRTPASVLELLQQLSFRFPGCQGNGP
ncbi:hypothetical protein AVEN_31864-1 [Araneus ventricosus]|uniref:Uncharacterized protein n=1 Tax=Araneus ventricosus TaxID=182803 RepID=A0A4Y2F9J6_ARAVE|nr:hypothetical protein AVEN_31864-1 [Araneus ventricosus]